LRVERIEKDRKRKIKKNEKKKRKINIRGVFISSSK